MQEVIYCLYTTFRHNKTKFGTHEVYIKKFDCMFVLSEFISIEILLSNPFLFDQHYN